MNKKKTRRPGDPKAAHLPAPGPLKGVNVVSPDSQVVRRRGKSCLTCNRQLQRFRLPTSPWVH